ncbi:Lysophospholipase L1 [Thermoflavifilum thermophilum]|uniref:Lysophospholipase L1 n=2 Tax=Thermoflavifilum thermophilum TaxID=1393122 RepID=A0A1I7N7U3_9BACT|nr:Lysophospholipase L1 [Thermoflavifilum thermophilum]
MLGWMSLWAFMLQPAPVQVVCFGDSITHGAEVDGHSWVWMLQQQHGHDQWQFINAGRNGRRTADKQELLPVLQQYPQAAFYLIFLGVNDLKNASSAQVDSCVQNMRWMIEQIRQVNPQAKVIILSPCNINLQSMSALNRQKQYNARTQEALFQLEKRYRQLAKSMRTGFVSLLHVVSPENYADGLHPNLAGQQQIADAVWKYLTKHFPQIFHT